MTYWEKFTIALPAYYLLSIIIQRILFFSDLTIPRPNTTQTAITDILDRSRVLENVLDIYRGEPDLTL